MMHGTAANDGPPVNDEGMLGERRHTARQTADRIGDCRRRRRPCERHLGARVPVPQRTSDIERCPAIRALKHPLPTNLGEILA